MRAFIVIEIPDTIRGELQCLSTRLRESGARASWVKEDQMHLTLRFLGDIAEDAVPQLSEALEEGCAALASFPLAVKGVGVFPNARRPAVVWVGAEAEDPKLNSLWQLADEGARSVAVPPESKAFHPHVTLARIRDPRQTGRLAEFLEREAGFDAGEFEVRSVSLFSSRLTPQGPIHRLLKEFAF